MTTKSSQNAQANNQHAVVNEADNSITPNHNGGSGNGGTPVAPKQPVTPKQPSNNGGFSIVPSNNGQNVPETPKMPAAKPKFLTNNGGTSVAPTPNGHKEIAVTKKSSNQMISEPQSKRAIHKMTNSSQSNIKKSKKILPQTGENDSIVLELIGLGFIALAVFMIIKKLDRK
ncbi:LPXTG cell wall anchor domain-containing protein [Fructilactobacillus fructivorans]|nr:LPXTG cell wall anchor domain-containing protein [Fructilactobacillus fructivorans]